MLVAEDFKDHQAQPLANSITYTLSANPTITGFVLSRLLLKMLNFTGLTSSSLKHLANNGPIYHDASPLVTPLWELPSKHILVSLIQVLLFPHSAKYLFLNSGLLRYQIICLGEKQTYSADAIAFIQIDLCPKKSASLCSSWEPEQLHISIGLFLREMSNLLATGV